MSDLKQVDRTLYSDYMAPQDCTHVLYEHLWSYSFWKIEGDKHFKWIGNEQWQEYEIREQ